MLRKINKAHIFYNTKRLYIFCHNKYTRLSHRLPDKVRNVDLLRQVGRQARLLWITRHNFIDMRSCMSLKCCHMAQWDRQPCTTFLAYGKIFDNLAQIVQLAVNTSFVQVCNRSSTYKQYNILRTYIYSNKLITD